MLCHLASAFPQTTVHYIVQRCLERETYRGRERARRGRRVPATATRPQIVGHQKLHIRSSRFTVQVKDEVVTSNISMVQV
uniref:Uncharacterized protein n=1 Tax=Helianthus annuus TaxID=4232 RepID=A0A251UEN6_HELAN